MPEMPPSVDFYAALGLDRAASPRDLAAELSHRIDRTPPGPARIPLEQARAVLGDPGKKAAYDARLNDPAARPWTPPELHNLAMATPQPSGFARFTGAGRQRIITLSAVAAALTLVLVLVIVAVTSSGSGGDGSSSTAADRSSGTTKDGDLYTDAAGNEFMCGRMDRKGLYSGKSADWPVERFKDPDARPARAFLLEQAIDLPPAFDALTGLETLSTANTPYYFVSTTVGLAQYQDKNVGVNLATPLKGWTRETVRMNVAVLSRGGQLVSSNAYAPDQASQIPKPFDLQQRTLTSGYYRIEAKDGVTIPSVAAGTKPTQNFALQILPDAFDENVYWVLMRGSAKLYKAGYFWITSTTDLAPYAEQCDQPA
ncbi:hypothetical protein [Gordonia alkaliphila]|uniref:J domain-containing protein n=1 Tax=Gordonia alkaliphila TaxID=1053547 RepID=A0ABP8YY36_9ACTN